jgi:hypothetical protein
MRGILFTSILTAATLIARPATAQSSGFTGTLGGGVTIPTGDASNSYKTGVHGDITFGYRPHNSALTVSAEVGLHQLKQITLPADNLTKAYGNIWEFMGRLDYSLAPAVYITADGGLIRAEHRIRAGTIAPKTTSSATGFGGGLGVKLAKRFFAEGRVLTYSSKGTSTLLFPITVGVRF